MPNDNPKVVVPRASSVPGRMELLISGLTALLFFSLSASGSASSIEPLKLVALGTEKIIDYAKYGDFQNVGSEKFFYRIKDRKGLAQACAEGVDPNRSVFDDPAFIQIKKSGQIKGPHWDYTDHIDKSLRFYAWADAKEDPGVRQYYTGKALEDNGCLLQAIQAYYAQMVLYPRSVGWSYWKTPLYISRMSLDRILYLVRNHPELGLHLEGAYVRVENGFDDDTSNDRIVINPGHWVNSAPVFETTDLTTAKIVKTVGGSQMGEGRPSIQLVQYDNGQWQLLKDGKPYRIQAMAYVPTPVGVGSKTFGYDVNGTWQTADRNHNGLVDATEECWVDANKNNLQDADEALTSDVALMKRMGVNTLRVYHHVYNKELLRKWHKENGMMFLIGDFAGGYAAGSGVDFHTGTDYNNPEQVKNMLESIRSMVMSEKDESYVLMWVLGNENVYGVGNNAKSQPEAFFRFINQAAQLIHELDPTRPVAISNGDLYRFDLFVELCPAVDVFGCNIYRGNGGMGDSFWRTIRDMCGKPVLITEYGSPAFGKNRTPEQIEQFQLEYHQSNWEDIAFNMAGGPGYGNALGGVAFEFCDEWWKAELFSQKEHDAQAQHPAPFCDGYNYEEFFGLYSLGSGQDSPFLRQPRRVVDYYTQVWNRP